MKINVRAELEGKELADLFLAKLVDNNVITAGSYPSDGPHTKFSVQKKDGEWAELTVDKVKLVFSREQ